MLRSRSGARSTVATCLLVAVVGQYDVTVDLSSDTTTASPLDATTPTASPAAGETVVADSLTAGTSAYLYEPTSQWAYSPAASARGYSPAIPGAGGYNPGAGQTASAWATSGSYPVMQAGSVDCGGHIEKSCGECPQGNGKNWCNGQCAWVATPSPTDSELGTCLPKVPLPGIAPELSPLGASFYYWIGIFVATMLLQTVFAFVFYVRVVTPREKFALPQVSDISVAPLRRHIFDCFQHKETAVYATFALPVLAAKNVHIAGVMPYWAGFFIMALALCGPFALWGYWPGFAGCVALVALVRVFISIQVQKNLGFTPNIVKTCVYNIFCMPCDIGRESLEADQEVGGELKGFFDMEFELALEAAMGNLVDKTVAAERNCVIRACGFKGHS